MNEREHNIEHPLKKGKKNAEAFAKVTCKHGLWLTAHANKRER